VHTTAHPPLASRAASEGSRQVSWLDLLLPATLMAICSLAGITALGLTGPDEPRYASIARAMARTGDWITPRLNGQPWSEKPALYYWLAGIAYRIFGEGEFAMRLPSVLGAVLATLAAAWAALRAYGLDAARLTLFMLPATIGMIGFSHSAAGDMLFTALLAATAAAAAEILQAKRPGLPSRIAFGALLGAAVLAKGPAAVVLAGGSVLLWALLSRRIAAAFGFFHPACLAAFAAVAVPWYALCAARNPDFVRVFFFEHNFQRYLTPMFQHPQPFWFFVPVLLAAAFPWTVLTAPLLLDAARAPKSSGWRDSPAMFFACWVAFPLLFFSFSESKLPGYMLPALPPLVLLLATALARRISTQGAPPHRWLVPVALSFPFLALFSGVWLRQLPADSGLSAPAASSALLALAAGGGVVCALLAWKHRERAAIGGIAALMAALVVATASTALPTLDPYLSARQAAEVTMREAARVTMQEAAREATQTTAREAGPGDPVFVYAADRSLQFGLEYYLDRPVPDWTASAPRPAWVWTTPARSADLERFGGAVVRKLTQEAWLMRINAPGP